MKNTTFKEVFLTLGGAAAGANVASLAVGTVMAVVPLAAPVIGAVLAGGLAFAAAEHDKRSETSAAAEPQIG